MKKIAFHSNQLSIRGTEVALYQYAKYNEEILGNKSVIFLLKNRIALLAIFLNLNNGS